MIPAKANTLLKLATMLTFLVAFVSACGTTQKIGKPGDGKKAGAGDTIPCVYSYNVVGKEK
jgi:hypothetical protein